MEIPHTRRAEAVNIAGPSKDAVRSHEPAPAKPATSSQLAWFCYQFALALKAGLPAVEAISLIAGDNRCFGEP